MLYNISNLLMIDNLPFSKHALNGHITMTWVSIVVSALVAIFGWALGYAIVCLWAVGRQEHDFVVVPGNDCWFDRKLADQPPARDTSVHAAVPQ